MKLFKFHIINFSSLKRILILYVIFILLVWLVAWGVGFIGKSYESRLEAFIKLSDIRYYTIKRSWLSALSFWLPLFGIFLFYTSTTSRIKRGYFRFIVGNNYDIHKILFLDILLALLFSLLTGLLFFILFNLNEVKFIFGESFEIFIKSFTTFFMWGIIGTFLALVLRKNLYLVAIGAYYYIEVQVVQTTVKYYLVYNKGFSEVWGNILPLNLLNFPFTSEGENYVQIGGFLLYLAIVFVCYKKIINSDL